MSGDGQAPRHTATPTRPTRCWKWSAGKSGGRWQSGGECLAARESPPDLGALRQCTHTGRPLGTTKFVTGIEQTTLRALAPQKGGGPKSPQPTAARTASLLLLRFRKLEIRERPVCPSVPAFSLPVPQFRSLSSDQLEFTFATIHPHEL